MDIELKTHKLPYTLTLSLKEQFLPLLHRRTLDRD